MYHIGKIIKVFKPFSDDSKSADNSVQAHLEMWDENEIIVLVHPALNAEVKEKEFALVRYTQPEPMVVKVFKQKEGKELWDKMQEYSERKKRATQYAGLRDNQVNRMIG